MSLYKNYVASMVSHGSPPLYSMIRNIDSLVLLLHSILVACNELIQCLSTARSFFIYIVVIVLCFWKEIFKFILLQCCRCWRLTIKLNSPYYEKKTFSFSFYTMHVNLLVSVYNVCVFLCAARGWGLGGGQGGDHRLRSRQIHRVGKIVRIRAHRR